jgi:hypothetical protein
LRSFLIKKRGSRDRRSIALKALFKQASSPLKKFSSNAIFSVDSAPPNRGCLSHNDATDAERAAVPRRKRFTSSANPPRGKRKRAMFVRPINNAENREALCLAGWRALALALPQAQQASPRPQSGQNPNPALSDARPINQSLEQITGNHLLGKALRPCSALARNSMQHHRYFGFALQALSIQG